MREARISCNKSFRNHLLKLIIIGVDLPRDLIIDGVNLTIRSGMIEVITEEEGTDKSLKWKSTKIIGPVMEVILKKTGKTSKKIVKKRKEISMIKLDNIGQMHQKVK
jgi:hypothetical protein